MTVNGGQKSFTGRSKSPKSLRMQEATKSHEDWLMSKGLHKSQIRKYKAKVDFKPIGFPDLDCSKHPVIQVSGGKKA